MPVLLVILCQYLPVYDIIIDIIESYNMYTIHRDNNTNNINNNSLTSK